MIIKVRVLSLLLFAFKVSTFDYKLADFMIFLDYSPSNSTFRVTRRTPENPSVPTSPVIPSLDEPTPYVITNNGVIVLSPQGTVFGRLEIEDSLCAFPIYCASVNSPPSVIRSGPDTVIRCNATGLESALTSHRLAD